MKQLIDLCLNTYHQIFNLNLNSNQNVNAIVYSILWCSNLFYHCAIIKILSLSSKCTLLFVAFSRWNWELSKYQFFFASGLLVYSANKGHQRQIGKQGKGRRNFCISVCLLQVQLDHSLSSSLQLPVSFGTIQTSLLGPKMCQWWLGHHLLCSPGLWVLLSVVNNSGYNKIQKVRPFLFFHLSILT